MKEWSEQTEAAKNAATRDARDKLFTPEPEKARDAYHAGQLALQAIKRRNHRTRTQRRAEGKCAPIVTP